MEALSTEQYMGVLNIAIEMIGFKGDNTFEQEFGIFENIITRGNFC